MAACLWCGKPATRLCDGTVGWTAIEENGRTCIGTGSEHFTCDAPMCDEHAKAVGRVRGTRELANAGKTEPRSIRWADTIDRCPSCIADPLPSLQLMTADEAEAIRRNRQAPVLRARLRSV